MRSLGHKGINRGMGPVVADIYLVFTDSHLVAQNLGLRMGIAAERGSWERKQLYCSSVRRVVNPGTRFPRMVGGEREVAHRRSFQLRCCG